MPTTEEIPSRSAAVRRLGRPGDVALTFGAPRPRQSLPKPPVPIGRVIGHDVDDHLDVSRMQRADHRVEVVQAAQSRVDVAVIIDVIAAIGKRGWIERAEPHRIDTERLQVRHARGDTWEVANPVTGAVGEAARVDLVDHRTAPQVRDRRTGDDLDRVCSSPDECAAIGGRSVSRPANGHRHVLGEWPQRSRTYVPGASMIGRYLRLPIRGVALPSPVP